MPDIFLLAADNKWSIHVSNLIIATYILEERADWEGGREEAEALEQG